MSTLVHIIIFLASAFVVWFFAGILIESVNRIATRLHKTGFIVAFFILGFLTSISEISVAVNATIDRVPQVSAGNLIGASLVILLFIIPFLAIAGKGIQLRHTASNKNIILAFAVILLPALLIIDGDMTRVEGVVMLLGYLVLAWAIQRQHSAKPQLNALTPEILAKEKIGWWEIAKVVIGGVAIFAATHFLVEQAVYFAAALSVPSSLMGLVLLSIGTNTPELVIAVRSIINKHKEIAFGDYLGSAAANTVIFGFLALLNGRFFVEPGEFTATAFLMAIGFVLFYFFAVSGRKISLKEGWVLMAFYVAFLAIQIANIFRFSGN